MNIVITGKREKDIVNFINDQNYTLQSSVNKMTNLLIAEDKNGSSTKIKKAQDLKIEIYDNVYDNSIDSDYIVSRAFKKLEAIIQVSREIAKKSHKLIILKGQNAQEELKKAFNKEKYDYKLENSITSEDSKIIIVDFKK